MGQYFGELESELESTFMVKQESIFAESEHQPEIGVARWIDMRLCFLAVLPSLKLKLKRHTTISFITRTGLACLV